MSPAPAPPSPPPTADLRDQARPRRRFRAIAAFILGVLLLLAAIWVIQRDGPRFQQALTALGQAPAWAIALAVGLYLLNFAFATASFWVLTGRYGRVRYTEMFALIGGATLLNYLPLRPGMIGRVGYHRVVHGIAVRDSVKVLFAALCCAGVAMLLLLLCAWAAHARALSTPRTLLLMSAPLAAALAAAVVISARDRTAAAGGRRSHLWRFPLAAAFRYLDMCVWTARYALIFHLLGMPLTPPAAAAVAFSSQAAMLSPVQLGLREWVVGTAAGAIAAAPSGRALALPTNLADLTPGLLADLLNRGFEFTVAIPLGLVMLPLLAVRLRRAAASASGSASANPPPASAL